jgi:hypothetical protein
VLVYTAALLLAPLPVMPFAPGTREFVWAVGACGALLAAASYYVARGEWRLGHRGSLGFKLLAASLITLLFGTALVAGSFVHLAYGKTVEGSLKVEPRDSRCAKGSEGWSVYDADAGHLWNRLYRSLYLRTARDGREFGRDEVDPLLWPGTGEHLLGGGSYARASACLEEFNVAGGERLVTDPLRRALLQRDLWAVFDWTVEKSERPSPELRELQRRLAAAIRRLALSPAQVESLPDTYRAAAASGAFAKDFDPRAPDTPFLPPDLFRPDGPWVALGVEGGGATAPMHVYSTGGRSVFSVFINLPQGRAATLAYLKSVSDFKRPWVRDRRNPADARPNPRLPQFPAGTRLTLVRRMLVVDARGEPVPTAVVESVQIRLHRALPTDIPEAFDSVGAAARASLSLYEFRLSRERLFAGEAGGLRAVARDEKEFPLFQSHGVDPFEDKDARVPLERDLRPVLGSCVACHFRPGIHSVLSRQPDIVQLRLRDVRRQLLPAPGHGHEADITKAWKMRQESWKLLRELWEQAATR